LADTYPQEMTRHDTYAFARVSGTWPDKLQGFALLLTPYDTFSYCPYLHAGAHTRWRTPARGSGRKVSGYQKVSGCKEAEGEIGASDRPYDARRHVVDSTNGLLVLRIIVASRYAADTCGCIRGWCYRRASIPGCAPLCDTQYCRTVRSQSFPRATVRLAAAGPVRSSRRGRRAVRPVGGPRP
jgi:hypothetical protein